MMSFGLIVLVISVGTFVSSVPTCRSKPYYDIELAEVHFEEFLNTFNKTYDDEMEKQHRIEIFRENLKKINELNADPTETAHFGINQFTDLTEEELQMYKGFQPPPISHDEPDVELSVPIDGPIPDDDDGCDWRRLGVVSRVKTQGMCRSCWAFSAAGVAESAHAIKHNEHVEVSEQELVDCASSHGCRGGYPLDGLKFYQSRGAVTESSYPYRGSEQGCQYKKERVSVVLSSVVPLNVQNENALAQAVRKYGPISVAVSSGSWSAYTGGVFENCPAGNLDHAVLLVGFASENGKPYWIIKNSWGPRWGEQGYIRIRRGVNACNIRNPHAAAAVAA